MPFQPHYSLSAPYFRYILALSRKISAIASSLGEYLSPPYYLQVACILTSAAVPELFVRASFVISLLHASRSLPRLNKVIAVVLIDASSSARLDASGEVARAAAFHAGLISLLFRFSTALTPFDIATRRAGRRVKRASQSLVIFQQDSANRLVESL